MQQCGEHEQAFCKCDGMSMRYRSVCVAAIVVDAPAWRGCSAAVQPSGGRANPPTVQEQELVLGAWELDLSRSMFSPGPPPRSEIRSYQEGHEGIKAEILTVNADGTKTHMEYIASFND